MREVHPLALVAVDLTNLDPHAPQDHVFEEDYDEDETASSVSGASTRSVTPLNLEADPENVSESSERPNDESSNCRKRCYVEDDDEGSMCPICFDLWTSVGDHRVCALKCGHLFGFKCINRWLSTSGNRKVCPTCKERTKYSDIRHIFASKLVAVDTSQLECVKKQLHLMTEEQNRIQGDLQRHICREKMLNQEITRLRTQLNHLKKPMTTTNVNNTNLVRLYKEKTMDVCKFAGSRVFDVAAHQDLLMASMKSPITMFKGYGLNKMNISQYRPIAFIPAHSNNIRDIAFHYRNYQVLTASMDKTFKVIDCKTNTITHSFQHEMALWSCCWDVNNPFMLYTGTQNGAVGHYDTRNLSQAVFTQNIEGDMSPVVSVASIPASSEGVLSRGGLLSCKLESLWVFDRDYTRHPLGLEGPFLSMKYEKGQLLVSSRPNSKMPYARHCLCTLGGADGQINCNVVYTFQGSSTQKFLSRSCFVQKGGEGFVAAHQEDSKSIFLWNVNTGEKAAQAATYNCVLDLKGMGNQNGDFLVGLSAAKLEFFKFA